MQDRRVWKYILEAKDVQQIMMPEGAVILHVHTQTHYGTESSYLWALVNPEARLVARTFLAFSTGQKNVRGSYIGTFHYGETLVYHVFEDGAS